jgi:hypothetical protein
MAYATVRNAKVTAVFYDGKAARVAEEYQAQGQSRTSYTVLWFREPHNLQPGQTVTASGVASVKMGKSYTTQSGEHREGKPELHINVSKVDPASPASVADMQQLWPDVRQVPDDSVPF